MHEQTSHLKLTKIANIEYAEKNENRLLKDISLNRTKSTGILSHLGAKLRDWAVRQAGAGCYSSAAPSSNDSKTR